MANPLLDALLADREGNSASGFSPMSAPTPAAGARMIDFATPLPEMTPDAATSEDTLALPEEVDQTYTPLDAPEPAETSAEIAPAPRANPLLAALQADQAATQQAVAEATTPDDRLPIIRPELADALGVLDYRDPQEGQRRQQAAAVGEILNLPMFERVNLGAAPVNADGTVTIRRAQAVSPEAQAAADEQMEIIRLAAAKNLNPPTPSFLDKIQQRWRLGRESASDDQLAYRAMMGEVDYEKVKDQLNPSQQPQRGDNWLSEGFLGAVQMLPAMVDGIISGNKLGLQGAMAGGTAAAIAGQVGPQVLTPEEIVTVPAAAALGYSAGTAAGSSEYWYKQGAGSMYHALRKEGIPHEIASNVSAGFGAPYAGIELAQVTKLVPGLKQTAAQAVAGGLKKRLTALAVEKTGEYATQIGQETLQEANNITGEALAEWIAGVKPPAEKASAWDRIAGTIKESALSIPFLMAPKGVVDTVQTVRGPDQNQTTPPPPPPTAPAEVPQNFTPISSPAPAPGPVAPAPAPQNLGQVRALEIPIDQAALDEAFGSPFAPPQPAPADPFAPTPASAEVNPQVNPAPVSNDTSAPSAAPAPASTTISPPANIAPTDWESAIRSAPRVPMFPGDPQRRQTVSAIPILSQANAAPGMAVVAINGRTGAVTDQRDSMGLVVQMDDGTTERMNAFTTFHLQSDVVPFLKAPQQSGSQQTPSPSSTPPAATIQPAPRNAAEAAQLREEQAQAQLPGVMEGFGNGARHGTALRVEQSPLTISSPQAVQIVLQNPNDYEFTPNQDGTVVISGAFDPVDNVWRGKPKTKPQPTRVVPSQVVVGDTIQLGGSPRLVTSVSTDKGTTTIVATNPETGTQQTLSGSDRMLEVEVVSRAQPPQPPAQQSTATTSTPITPSPITVSTDWLSSFTEKPQAQQAARDWWRTNRPEPVEVSHPKFDTPIVVSWQGVKHATRNSAGLDELATVPFIQDAIANSEWVGQAPDKRKRNTIQAVHELRAPILLNNELKDLRIVVRQTTSGTLFYDHSYIKPTEPAVTSEEPGSQDSDQQAASSTSPNTQSPPSVNPPDLQNTESDFEASMRNAMRRNRQGGFVDIQAVQEFGQSIYQAGKSFAQWSGEMVRKFGETIRDVLETIWEYVSGQNYLPQARERGSVAVPGKATVSSKPRSFPQTVAAAPGVAPEVKAQLTALDYDPISNAQTVASARSRIDAAGSMDSAVTQFMGNAANPDFQPTAVDYATGIELLGQLQSRGRHEDAAAIADFMARAGTTQGQAIQALSLISRLTPAGIEAFAARQITRAARNDPKIEELIQDNQRLRAEIAAAKRDSATAAIVDNRAAIKAALPAGADAVATNIAIREAILQSPTPLAAQAATARILQDNGLSERAAIRIAQSITKDFLKTTTDSRAKVLQDLLALAEKDRRFNKSKLGSLIRLNREGKLTDSRLHADMAKMLGIPAWTPEHSAKVQDLLRQREAATDPRVKLVKAAEALDVIYRESMPAGMLAKIDTFQTLMMLLNPKTWIRNIGGNAFMFGADLSADTVAWGADAAVSIVTGNRTRTGLDLGTRFSELGAGLGDIQAGYEFARTQGMGRLGSFKEGVQTLIRLGRLYSSKKYDSAEITGFTGTTFQRGIGKVLEDTLGAALSLVDRGFYQSAFRASLDNQMRLAAQDGPPLAAPTPDMIAQARMDASRAVYQDENAASRTLSGLRRVLNANQRWGLGSMLMKFTQVPGSILMRGIEFSPLGFIRNAYQLLAPALSNRVAFDQKAFTEQFSRALVGTTGLVATGYWLAQLGIISAGRENEDEKKRNLAKAEGWGSYKLNVSALKRALMTGNFWTRQPRQDGDVVVNYDWAQPLSISVAMGAYAKENQKAVQEDILRGKKQSLLATGFNWMSAAAASATGAMNALVEQPLLSGLSTFFRNAAYDDIPGAILAAASDVPKSMMPTAARQWMQLDDNTVRETRDSSPFRQYVNELKSQLPGLSQTLPAKRDILGEDVERYQRQSNTVFNVLFNPSMVTYIKKSPLLTEMSQVYEMTGNPSVIPNQAGRDFTIEGVKVRLTTEEISALQKDMGALSVAAVEKFVLDDPRYDKATWDIKAKAFTRALEKAATASKYRILFSRPDLKQRAQIEHQQTIQRRQEMQQMMDSGVGAALMQ